MILGNICTRHCEFCGVKHGVPDIPDGEEPANIAIAVRRMGLEHAVITSVTRDDLADRGAGWFARTIQEIRSLNPSAVIEVLIPDFKGERKFIESVVSAGPDIIGHNVDTVPSLYGKVRPQAVYERSLAVIRSIKTFSRSIYTKSALLLGMGEKEEEVIGVMKDLRNAGCDIFILGQYLQPTREQMKVERFVEPEEFESFGRLAESMGFLFAVSGTFVRSSYRARDFSAKFISNFREEQG